MTISKWYTETIAITRMNWGNDSSAEISAGSILGHIQQAGPDYNELVGDAWSQVFILWCSKSSGVQEGDTLTVASGDYAGTYSVRKKQLNATGNNQHSEFIIMRDNV